LKDAVAASYKKMGGKYTLAHRHGLSSSFVTTVIKCERLLYEAEGCSISIMGIVQAYKCDENDTDDASHSHDQEETCNLHTIKL
jgi:hypothetical protein